MKKIIVAFFLSVTSAMALAEIIESSTPFKISEIYVANATKYHFRIMADYSDSTKWLCNNGPKNPAWAYINEADSGAAGMISTLLTAYAAGKTVTLYTTGIDGPSGRVCKIVEFSIKN